MKHIQLTQDQFAIVDDEDYDELSKHRWYAWWNRDTRSYYAVRSIWLPNRKKTTEYMHRLILGLKYGDKRQGDHLNHHTLDNRRTNIRVVSCSENQHNRHGKGFRWRKKKYEAYIAVNGTQKHLGRFDDPAEARTAYLQAKRIYHPTTPLAILEKEI